ncbi:MAG: AI-2E family transporter [Candidatus Saccharimonadales bacterium]
METKINLDLQTITRFWLVPLGIVVTGYALYSARTALFILGAALFVAVALNGPVSRIAKMLPGNSRVGGTALSFTLVVAFLGMFITLVIPPIVQQTVKFIETVPAIAESATTQYDGVKGIINRYQLQGQVDQALENIKGNTSSWAANLGGNVVGSLSSIGGFLVSLVLTLVLAFLMLVEGPGLLRKFWALYDDRKKLEYHQHLLNRIYGVVNSYVIGQLTIAAIGAVVMGVFVFILSLLFPEVASNLAIPAVAIYFVFCLIPMFGSTLAAVLIGLLLVLNNLVAALVFGIGFLIYQQIENNVVAPGIQSKKMELTALWVLTAVTIGIYVFGIVGAIVSIPIAGSLKVFLDDYLAQRSKEYVEKTIKKSPLKLAKKTD